MIVKDFKGKHAHNVGDQCKLVRDIKDEREHGVMLD